MLLDDVATYLDAQSTALALRKGTAGNLAKAQSLDSAALPNTCVVLYETAGSAGAHTWSTGGSSVAYESPRLQVISRSTSYVTARTNAQTVYTTLDQFSGYLPTSTGTRYLSIDAIQAPYAYGRDDNDRFLVTTNYAIRKEVG